MTEHENRPIPTVVDDEPIRPSYVDVVEPTHPTTSDLSLAVLDQIRQAVCITGSVIDRPGPVIEYVNEAYLDIFLCERSDVIGRSPRFAQGPLTSRSVLDRIRQNLHDGRSLQAQAINYRSDRSTFRLKWSIDPIVADGRIVNFVALLDDVTTEDRMRRRLAAVDTLLGASLDGFARPMSDDDVAEALIRALEPMVSEIGRATVEVDSRERCIGAASDGFDRSTAPIGDVGLVTFEIHPDASALFGRHGTGEVAAAAARMCGRRSFASGDH